MANELPEVNPYVPFLPDGSPNPNVSDATRAAWAAMDVESNADIINRMGSISSRNVDIKRVKNIPKMNRREKFNLGLPIGNHLAMISYTNKDMEDLPQNYKNNFIVGRGKNKFFNNMKNLEKNTIYAFGAENSNPTILGHEFRHMASPGYWNEYKTRLMDVYSARNLNEWDKAVKLMSEYNDMTFEEQEKGLIKFSPFWLDSFTHDYIRSNEKTYDFYREKNKDTKKREEIPTLKDLIKEKHYKNLRNNKKDIKKQLKKEFDDRANNTWKLKEEIKANFFDKEKLKNFPLMDENGGIASVR